MLPAPYYTEVPADLGDDLTWARQAGASSRDSVPTDAPGRCRPAAAGGWLASAAQALICRARQLMAA